MVKQSNSSWEEASAWYDSAVGEKGHYYHRQVILPGLLKLMELKESKDPKVLDLACGQGVLARALPEKIPYVGVDASKSLIQSAQKQTPSPNHRFLLGDVTKDLPLEEKNFSHATLILALQNIEKGSATLQNAATYLRPGGHFFLVINHPCFRIPRQSSWGFDQEKKCQYRRVDRYLSSLKIPIQTHPGLKKGNTWTFHHSLSEISEWLAKAGFAVLLIEEWCSDKKSEGGRAKAEDLARQEFPLFMAMKCVKLQRDEQFLQLCE